MNPFDKQKEFFVKLIEKIEHENINRIGPFSMLKENEIRVENVPHQTPPPPPIVNNHNQASYIISSTKE